MIFLIAITWMNYSTSEKIFQLEIEKYSPYFIPAKHSPVLNISKEKLGEESRYLFENVGGKGGVYTLHIYSDQFWLEDSENGKTRQITRSFYVNKETKTHRDFKIYKPCKPDCVNPHIL